MSKRHDNQMTRCKCGATESTQYALLSECRRCPCGQMLHTQYDLLLHYGHTEDDNTEVHVPNKQLATKQCTECGGTGQLIQLGGDWGKSSDKEVPCWACNGTGRVTS